MVRRPAVRAGDFVFAWQRLADPANDSPSASLLSVVAGYDAVRETGDVSLLQVTAEDDSTLVVVLNGKFDWFLTEVWHCARHHASAAGLAAGRRPLPLTGRPPKHRGGGGGGPLVERPYGPCDQRAVSGERV